MMISSADCSTTTAAIVVWLLLLLVQTQSSPDFVGVPLKCAPRLSEAHACLKVHEETCPNCQLVPSTPVFDNLVGGSCQDVQENVCPLITCCEQCDLTPLFNCTLQEQPQEQQQAVSKSNLASCSLDCNSENNNPTEPTTKFGVFNPQVLQACTSQTQALETCVASATDSCNGNCITPRTRLLRDEMYMYTNTCDNVETLFCTTAENTCCGSCQEQVLAFTSCVMDNQIGLACNPQNLCRDGPNGLKGDSASNKMFSSMAVLFVSLCAGTMLA